MLLRKISRNVVREIFHNILPKNGDSGSALAAGNLEQSYEHTDQRTVWQTDFWKKS